MSMDLNSYSALTSQLSMMGGLAPGATSQLNSPGASPFANVPGAGSLISQTLRDMQTGALTAPKPEGPEALKKRLKEEKKDALQERIAKALEKIAARSESSAGTAGSDEDTAALAAYGSFDFDA